MLYSGQEVGEPALEKTGFGGGNARTTIFDYWSMTEFAKWVNGGAYDGGKLSSAQNELRDWYGNLIRLMHEPAFTRGEFYGLNHANKENPGYGRIDGETTSGHWLYSYLRHDRESGQAFLIVANFHGHATLQGVRIQLPAHALEWLGVKENSMLKFSDRLTTGWKIAAPTAPLPHDGVPLPPLPPLSAMVIEVAS